MTAGRMLVTRAMLKRAVIQQHIPRDCKGHVTTARGDAVATSGDADDVFTHVSADGIAATKSSAIMAGPAISAARPCSQTAAEAASNASMPRARSAAII